MSKLFLHVGAHKTGTTSLQSLFCAYRTQLKDQGVIYPKSCFFQYAQHRLAFALKNMKDPATGEIPSFQSETEDLRKEVEKAGTDNDFLLSSEEFLSLSPERVKALLHALYSIFSEIEVLVTLRRQDNQFVSIYNQKVKSFGNKFFRHYTRFLDVPTLLDAELDYATCLANWSENLAQNSNVKIFVYEKEEALSQAYFDYLCKKPFEVDDVRVNKSVSVVALEFVRHLKARSISETEVERLGRIAYSFFKDEPGTTLITKEDRKKILDYFQSCNQSVEEKFDVSLEYDYQSCEKSFDNLSVRRLNVNDVFSFFLNNR